MRIVPQGVSSYIDQKTIHIRRDFHGATLSRKVADWATMNRYSFLEKVATLGTGQSQRPNPAFGPFETANVRLPNARSYLFLRDHAWSVSIARSSILKLAQETFRNGADFQRNFATKCNNCGEEFQELVTDSEGDEEPCKVCGHVDFRDPNPLPLQDFKPFIKRANLNDQPLLEVYNELEDDLNIGDDAYLVVLKTYIWDGEDYLKFPREILRGDPDTMRKVMEPMTNIPGGRWWKCLEPGCNQVVEETDREKGNGLRCPVHPDRPLHEVVYVSIPAGSRGDMLPQKFYVRGEVKHRSKYSPSQGYGFAPIKTLFPEIETTFFIDERNKRLFEKGRPPGILTMPTRDAKNVRKFIMEAMDEAQDKPNMPLIIGSDPNAKNPPLFLNLLGTNSETQSLEVKKDLREAISRLYGVSPVFQADTSTSGGLNNEGIQLTVTNRAVEKGQRTYNDGFSPWLLLQFGVTDFNWALNPNNEQDEVADKQRLAQDLANAQVWHSMGGDVQYIDGKILISGDVKPVEELQGLGEVGGLFRPDAGTQSFDGDIDLSGQTKRDIEEDKYKFEHELAKDDLVKVFRDDALDAIEQGALFEKYAQIPATLTPRIHAVIRSAFEAERLSIPEMVKSLTDLGLSEGKAELIARTESVAVAQKARELGWRKSMEERDEVFKFKVVITRDDRTSSVSKRIAARVASAGGSVTLDEMKQIYKEESTKSSKTKNEAQRGMGSDWTGWESFVGHPHERDRVVRVI